MDDRTFDTIAQNVAAGTSRRGAFRALTGAIGAAVAVRFGIGAVGAQEAEACNALGEPCGGKRGDCCGGTRCKNRRCVCGRGDKECNGTCIKEDKCCTSRDCENQGETCRPNGTCACPAGKRDICDNRCTNNQTDPKNCGDCGNKCAPGAACQGGECGSVVVTPDNLRGWTNPKPGANYEAISFVSGPGEPQLGDGSIRFALSNNGSARVLFNNVSYAGTRLDSITELEYATYQVNGSGTGVVVPAIKLPSVGVPAASGTQFATFIFEPTYDEGSDVQPNQWQEWDALAASARWWSSKDIPDGQGGFVMCNPNGGNANTPACTGKLYVPWMTVLQAAPDAELSPGETNGLQIETGSGTPNADGNVDYLTINGTTFDFEPSTLATGQTTQRAARSNQRKDS